MGEVCEEADSAGPQRVRRRGREEEQVAEAERLGERDM